LPAACGGGQKSAVPLRGTAGGQKFLSPKTPFLFACLFCGEPEKIFKALPLTPPAYMPVDNSHFLFKTQRA